MPEVRPGRACHLWRGVPPGPAFLLADGWALLKILNHCFDPLTLSLSLSIFPPLPSPPPSSYVQIRTKDVKFSPTGRAWAAATTEGLVIYSLDDRCDPTCVTMLAVLLSTTLTTPCTCVGPLSSPATSSTRMTWPLTLHQPTCAGCCGNGTTLRLSSWRFGASPVACFGLLFFASPRGAEKGRSISPEPFPPGWARAS